MTDTAAEGVIRSALLHHLPALADAPITRLRRGGSAFAIGTQTIARVGNARQYADVLGVAAQRSTLPVPVPLFVDTDHDVLAYRRIGGIPLPGPEVTAHGASLAAFLNRLHGTYVGTVDRVVAAADPALDDPAARLEAAHQRRRRLHDALSVAARALVDRRLAVPVPAPARQRALCHLRLGAPHLLMHPATGDLCGVLGWGAAAIADPARDFAVVLTDLGVAMYDALMAGYRGRHDAGVPARATLFARCLLLERIEQGLIGGDRAAARGALRQLQQLT